MVMACVTNICGDLKSKACMDLLVRRAGVCGDENVDSLVARAFTTGTLKIGRADTL